MTDPQNFPQKRREILQNIRDLDNKITSLNQQKQQLLRELKSTPTDESCVSVSKDIYSDKGNNGDTPCNSLFNIKL